MFLSLGELFEFTNLTPKSQNFVQGEKLINANHVLYCGKLNETDAHYELLAFCSKTPELQDNPHEITILTNKSGKIISTTCSCTTDLNEKCEHIAAVLLFCNRNDLDELQVVSSADKKFLWNTPYKLSSLNYDPKPLSDHACFKIKKVPELPEDISKEIQHKLMEFMKSTHKN